MRKYIFFKISFLAIFLSLVSGFAFADFPMSMTSCDARTGLCQYFIDYDWTQQVPWHSSTDPTPYVSSESVACTNWEARWAALDATYSPILNSVDGNNNTHVYKAIVSQTASLAGPTPDPSNPTGIYCNGEDQIQIWGKDVDTGELKYEFVQSISHQTVIEGETAYCPSNSKPVGNYCQCIGDYIDSQSNVAYSYTANSCSAFGFSLFPSSRKPAANSCSSK